MASVSQKAANLTVRLALLEQVRELDNHLSRDFGQHATGAVWQRSFEQWRQANQGVVAANDRHIERDGQWSDGSRSS